MRWVRFSRVSTLLPRRWLRRSAFWVSTLPLQPTAVWARELPVARRGTPVVDTGPPAPQVATSPDCLACGELGFRMRQLGQLSDDRRIECRDVLELRRRRHPIAKCPRRIRHPVVVGDDLGEIASQARRGCQMDGVERAQRRSEQGCGKIQEAATGELRCGPARWTPAVVGGDGGVAALLTRVRARPASRSRTSPGTPPWLGARPDAGE